MDGWMDGWMDGCIMHNATSSDAHHDAAQIHPHRRNSARMVRRFRERGSNPAIRIGDGGEFHGYQALVGFDLFGGFGVDQGERD